MSDEVRLNDAELDAAAQDFYFSRNARLVAEKDEKADRERMLSSLDGHHKEHGAKVYRTSDRVAITLSERDGNPRIDGSKLLALGVDPDIIRQATERTPYTIYAVKMKG